MGIIIDSENKFSDQVFDIVIIFILGVLLLFFFNTMINHKRTFLISYASYIACLLVIMTIFINFKCERNDLNSEKNTSLQIVNFMSIYTICVNILLLVTVMNNYVYINEV